MRRIIPALCLVASLFMSAVGASAGPTVGGFSSGNVEYITHVPLENDTAGARILGTHLYITNSRTLTIYDISDPVAPARLGSVVLPQQVYFAQEDLDTNGEIALVAAYTGALGGGDPATTSALYVIDVEDKSNPRVLSSLAGAGEHTNSCVLDCSFAYGSGGGIVDLRNPAKPKMVGNWTEGMPAGSAHDVTEVAPGLVVTSSNPIMLLDARKNPAKPKLRALGNPGDGRFIHGNSWPHSATDKFLLVGGESSGPTCDDNTSATFMTFDARNWKKTRSFKLIDEYFVKQGLPSDGDAAANLYCTHWFDTHPEFSNGGLLALAWYEHGTRFLSVSKAGKISEVGYFIPYGGSTSAAYWATDEILYSVDYNRGLDILRFTGK